MAHIPPSGAAVAEALQERWGNDLRAGERFTADLERTEGGVRVLAALVAGPDHFEFEAEAPGTAAEAFDRAADGVDALIGEWLEAGRPRLRDLPEVREIQGAPVRCSARLRRPGLEAEADRLLGEDGEG